MVKYILYLALLLTSCSHKPLTHDELLQNPDTLRQTVETCDAQSITSDYCGMVKDAATEFMSLVYKREGNAELFGQEILDTQMKMAEESDIHSKNYQVLEARLKILLAVVGATSSE